MRRINTEVKKDVQADLYGLGGMDMITLAGAHIIADAVDRLTGAVVALSEQLERARDVAMPVFETKAPDEIKKAV